MILCTTRVKQNEFGQELDPVAIAEEACKATGWESYSSLDILAIALAYKGRFDEAIGWQEKAIAKCPTTRQAHIDQMTSRLNRFKIGKTFTGQSVAKPN